MAGDVTSRHDIIHRGGLRTAPTMGNHGGLPLRVTFSPLALS